MEISEHTKLSQKIIFPKSKSILIRMIFAEGLVFLCQENSLIKIDFYKYIIDKFNLDENLSDDVLRTILIMQFLVDFDYILDKDKFIKEKKLVDAVYLCNDYYVVDCGESATLYCFLLPIVDSFFPKIKLTGSKKLLERVNNHTRESSQPLSAKAIVAPLSNEGVSLDISSSMQSLHYFLLTIEVLKLYGIKIEENKIDSNTTRYFIRGGQKYISCEKEKTLCFIEDDYTIVSYVDAYYYMFDKKHKNQFDINKHSFQADKNYTKLFSKISSDNTTTISLRNNPDLGPILFCLSAILGDSEFHDLNSLRTKESDRIFCMKEELSKLGVNMDVVFEDENSVEKKVKKVIVHKSEIHRPTLPIMTHNDHRIAMAMSILLCENGGEILGTECVKKSFPNFFDIFDSENK